MWLILGGSGFLGTALRHRLKRRGIPFDAPASADCNLLHPGDVEAWIRETAPKGVINCVAMTQVDLCETHQTRAWALNARAPAKIAAACRDRGISFVHFSTDYVFSGTKKAPYLESDLTDPINVYGWTKRLGEEAIQAIYPGGSLILRTAWLFAERGKGFFAYLATALRESRPKLELPRQVGSPTYLDDLAETTLNLIEEGRAGLYHVVNAGAATWEDLALFFASRAPGGEKLEISESPGYRRPARRPTYSVLETKKLRETAGIIMRPWQEAAAMCIKKMTDNCGEN